jgi:hypothetical protein
MSDQLTYFKQAATDPANVPPWSVWWAENSEAVEHALPLMEFVRLKHRRLKGAIEYLKKIGQLPPDFQPPHPLTTGICPDCGDPLQHETTSPDATNLSCKHCGLSVSHDNAA